MGVRGEWSSVSIVDGEAGSIGVLSTSSTGTGEYSLVSTMEVCSGMTQAAGVLSCFIGAVTRCEVSTPLEVGRGRNDPVVYAGA